MEEARAEQQMGQMMGQTSLQGQGPGKTTIADIVVAKIAGIAAREVPGVHDLVGGMQRALGGALQRIAGVDQRAQGVSVVVGQEEAVVDINMVIDYGQSIPDITNQVRQNVMNQINSFTGLRVKEVNIAVNDLWFPQEQAAQQMGESEQRVA